MAEIVNKVFYELSQKFENNEVIGSLSPSPLMHS